MGLFSKKTPPPPSRHFTAARQIRLAPLNTTAAETNLEKADAGGHVSLVKRAQSAGEEMQKRGLLGRQAEVWLLLDGSGSMGHHYTSGAVQTILERALGFGLLTSPTGTVNVVRFASAVSAPVVASQANYQGMIGREIPMPWGSTDLTGALRMVLDRAKVTEVPLFVIVVADGGADDPTSATRLFCELSQYPVFVKLLAVDPVLYFATLDDLDDTHRLLDNIDAKPESGGKRLVDMDDDEYAAAMLDEWDTWIDLARTAGILA